jgi:hypothetical protein
MRERERGGMVGQQASVFKVRFGRYRWEVHRDRETNKQRDITTELTIKIPSKAG